MLEHRFTKPADSVVNGLMGTVTLLTVYDIADPLPWWLVVSYCTFVFVVGTVCTVVEHRSECPRDEEGCSTGDLQIRSSIRARAAPVLYRVSICGVPVLWHTGP
jgi:hypothetical protein